MRLITNLSVASILLIFFLAPLGVLAQKASTAKSPPQMPKDVLTAKSVVLQSNVVAFKQSSISPDTAKATLQVRILERGGDTEPVQGATVLLRREDDKMLGRVTTNDGSCLFSAVPATYTVRVQMTGLKTLEKTGFTLEAGKVYDLDILMARQ
jgi:hypothetical protein